MKSLAWSVRSPGVRGTERGLGTKETKISDFQFCHLFVDNILGCLLQFSCLIEMRAVMLIYLIQNGDGLIICIALWVLPKCCLRFSCYKNISSSLIITANYCCWDYDSGILFQYICLLKNCVNIWNYSTFSQWPCYVWIWSYLIVTKVMNSKDELFCSTTQFLLYSQHLNHKM